jgi:hypothetical protein
MPGAPEIAVALRLFQEQPGVQAFGLARQRLGLSADGLVHLLSRAGVTEHEARMGILPDVTALWQRLRPAGGQARVAHGTNSPTDLDSFAASLQGLLDSPVSQAGGNAQATSRKRPAQASAAGQPSASRVRPDMAQETAEANVQRRPRTERAGRNDGLWGRLLRWGAERVFPLPPAPPLPSPAGSHDSDEGLPDPGAFTLEDLASLHQGGPVDRRSSPMDLSDLLDLPESSESPPSPTR